MDEKEIDVEIRMKISGYVYPEVCEYLNKIPLNSNRGKFMLRIFHDWIIKNLDEQQDEASIDNRKQNKAASLQGLDDPSNLNSENGFTDGAFENLL